MTALDCVRYASSMPLSCGAKVGADIVDKCLHHRKEAHLACSEPSRFQLLSTCSEELKLACCSFKVFRVQDGNDLIGSYSIGLSKGERHSVIGNESFALTIFYREEHLGIKLIKIALLYKC